MRPALALTLAVVVVAAIMAPAPTARALETPVQFLEITIPVPTGLNPALLPPIVRYEWQTLAGSPDPIEVRWILISTQPFGEDWDATLDYIRNNPNAPEWAPWTAYNPPDVGTSWVTPPTDFGPYVFAVQGRDANGNTGEDFTLDRNARRILVGSRTTGPLLTVTGDHLDFPIITNVVAASPRIITVPGGTALEFCWTADASAYGGVVQSYRYGWDIIDPNDDEQWEIDWTPFVDPGECSPTRVFFFGSHAFFIEVVDNFGGHSRAWIQVNLLPPLGVEPATWGRIKAQYGKK
jgi:hypothetical protein